MRGCETALSGEPFHFAEVPIDALHVPRGIVFSCMQRGVLCIYTPFSLLLFLFSIIASFQLLRRTSFLPLLVGTV